MLSEPDGALRVTGLPLPRISDLAHAADVRLWELSPHRASLEEAYMRMTQGVVDYRSTDDAKAGLVELPEAPYGPYGDPLTGHYGAEPGYGPPGPAQAPQQNWYVPPPPGENPYAKPVTAPAPSPAAPAGEQKTSEDPR